MWGRLLGRDETAGKARGNQAGSLGKLSLHDGLCIMICSVLTAPGQKRAVKKPPQSGRSTSSAYLGCLRIDVSNPEVRVIDGARLETGIRVTQKHWLPAFRLRLEVI